MRGLRAIKNPGSGPGLLCLTVSDLRKKDHLSAVFRSPFREVRAQRGTVVRSAALHDGLAYAGAAV
jgi:hypothetical protein